MHARKLQGTDLTNNQIRNSEIRKSRRFANLEIRKNSRDSGIEERLKRTTITISKLRSQNYGPPCTPRF